MQSDREPKRSKKSPEQVAKDLVVEQRRAEVAKLKLKGKTNRQIAEALKIGAATVDRDLKAVFARTRQVADDAIRVQKAVALEQIELGIQATMRVIAPEVEGDEEPLTDDLTLKAITGFKGLDERRSKLLGLEAPQAVVLTAVDQSIDRILDVAQRVLPAEHYERLVAAIAAETGGSETAGRPEANDEAAVH